MIKRLAMNEFPHFIKLVLSAFVVLASAACTSLPATMSVPEPTGTPVPTETSSANITFIPATCSVPVVCGKQSSLNRTLHGFTSFHSARNDMSDWC